MYFNRGDTIVDEINNKIGVIIEISGYYYKIKFDNNTRWYHIDNITSYKQWNRDKLINEILNEL